MGNDLTTKVLLVVIDGFGLAPNWGGNAISIAKMSNWESILKKYPCAILTAHGKAVGLAGNEIGNSEAGHLTIGAGRVVSQDSLLINRRILDGSFFNNGVLLKNIQYAKDGKRPLQIMGLLSNGSVHAAYNHLIALIKLCAIQKTNKIFLHLFADGRDTPAYNGINLVQDLIDNINKIKIKSPETEIRIASISGRYFAMDRDNHLDRTNKTLDCIIGGEGNIANSVLKVFSNAYSKGKTDETISPTNISDDSKRPVGMIRDGDPVISINFRQDRARQISEGLLNRLPNIRLVTFIPYGSRFVKNNFQIESAFKPEPINNGLAEYLSANKINQFHIAETEKYAHITYFFNCGVEKEFEGEDRVLIPSAKVATYDLYPQMKVEIVSCEVQKLLKKNKYRFGIVNIANPDMVGHTGILKAAVSALESTDVELGKIINTAIKNRWFVVVTSDHGNAEQMVDPKDGAIDPEHTTNPVPLVIIPPAGNIKYNLTRFGALADVAPTILKLLMLSKPKEMTGRSLI